MKVGAGQVAALLRNPGRARVVLLHGEDEGLVRHRGDALTLAVAGSADDPFRVAWLGADEQGRLAEEASAIAMLGGRRVVRVRGVGEALLGEVEALVAVPGDTLVVLEAGALTRRSKLLGWAEASGVAAAVACYPEAGKDLREAVAGGFKAAGVGVEPDALAWLTESLGGDYAATRGEIEKLVLYAGPGGRLDLDAVRRCVGDQGAASMDEAVYAATLGQMEIADRAVERAFAEGVTAVGLLRGMLGHLVRMHLVRGRMAGGMGSEAAVKGLRPPVFWKREKDLVHLVEGWGLERVSGAMAEVRRVELACKQTGAPDGVLVRRLFLAFARSSAARR